VVERTSIIENPNLIAETYKSLAALRRANKYKTISLAVRRLGLARMRADLDDVLLDTMISLEALLLSDNNKERGELAFRAALRAAQWSCLLGLDPNNVFDIVSIAYRLRNEIVHGGAISKDDASDVRGRVLRHNEVINEVSAIARMLAIDALDRAQKGGFDMHWRSLLTTSLEAHRAPRAGN